MHPAEIKHLNMQPSRSPIHQVFGMADSPHKQKIDLNISLQVKLPKNLSWHIPIVLLIFLLSFYIRMIPAQNMQYVQALDPYFISRMSSAIAENGNLPPADV